MCYLTFRTAVDRVGDSNRHLSELNRLYLSTIETLAMAIDAKDQITHGHIRRVQSYAVGLAREIGIKDESEIKAIEAAALLHDMGKLAVPEYILNKPGKLTGAEFEKMKLHASVGADILSSIDFPYPVVPIVRHHHENWDGKGYPDGIKSTDIPIGARILSVVDCFDALTSDRPYRPELSDDEALKILIERRGNMYDPQVVDTFIKVYKQIAPEPLQLPVSRNALREITTSSVNGGAFVAAGLSRLDDITASAEEMLTLYELARALAGNANLSTTGDVIMNHLRRLIPFSQSALYFYDVQSDEVVARHAVGDISSSIKGLRIPLGERLERLGRRQPPDHPQFGSGPRPRRCGPDARAAPSQLPQCAAAARRSAGGRSSTRQEPISSTTNIAGSSASSREVLPTHSRARRSSRKRRGRTR